MHIPSKKLLVMQNVLTVGTGAAVRSPLAPAVRRPLRSVVWVSLGPAVWRRLGPAVWGWLGSVVRGPLGSAVRGQLGSAVRGPRPAGTGAVVWSPLGPGAGGLRPAGIGGTYEACWDRWSEATLLLKGVCLLHLLSENIFPVLRSNWFYVLMKQKLIWNLSLCYFSLFCFYLSGYDARTAERKSDSTWRTWYKQTARVYHSRRPISWLIPEMQYPVIYIIKFSNN